ncbi:MAG: hypothetical protein ACYC9L_14420 [Sulfuricaulis sp.]
MKSLLAAHDFRHDGLRGLTGGDDCNKTVKLPTQALRILLDLRAAIWRCLSCGADLFNREVDHPVNSGRREYFRLDSGQQTFFGFHGSGGAVVVADRGAAMMTI